MRGTPKRMAATTKETPTLGKVYHGDFLEEAPRLLAGRRFDVVLADPPVFPCSRGRMLQEHLAWTDKWLLICKEHLAESGIVYVYGEAEELAHIAVRQPLERQRWLAWHWPNHERTSNDDRRFWQRSHTSILCLWAGKKPALAIDRIREPYTPAYTRCIGKQRKGTRGRFNSRGAASKYGGHKHGALPRDVLKVPVAAGDGTAKKPDELTRRLLLSVEGNNGALFPFVRTGDECAVAVRLQIPFVAVADNRRKAAMAKKRMRGGNLKPKGGRSPPPICRIESRRVSKKTENFQAY